MTTKEHLHQMVDELPEDRIATAEQLLEAVKTGAADSVTLALLLAPEDDEAETPEEAAAVQEAREQTELIPHEDVRRRLGL